MKTSQIVMVSLEDLVSKQHPYRKLKETLNLEELFNCFDMMEHDKGAKGYGKERLTACLILQFMEDNSDRKFERFLNENNSAKWFCGFSLTEKTPDYSTICKFRNSVGLENIEKLFETLKNQLKKKGYLFETFTFIDATALVSKFNLWEEKDKAI